MRCSDWRTSSLHLVPNNGSGDGQRNRRFRPAARRSNLRPTAASFRPTSEEISMTQARRHTFSARKLAVLLALVAASGCSLITDVNAPVFIAPYSAAPQTQVANTPLPLP